MLAQPTFLIVDLFWGAGGTTTGFAMAELEGNPVAKVIACVNHDAKAIESHWLNHPDVKHFEEDIRTLDLTELVQLVEWQREIIHPDAKLILWASLECTNFSKAKGGLPRDADSRTLRWKQPAIVFVNSMSDLFHEDVPFEFIDAVFRVMGDVAHHTYQVLTKRAERMIEFFTWKYEQWGIKWISPPNVWLGVSVEDQKAADERIPLLLQLPAAVRFLSCEPLLGAVNIASDKINHTIVKMGMNFQNSTGIDWVICGGESGNKARPMHPDWARSLRDQCNAAGVPFFFKQWGEWKPKRFHDPAESRPKDIGVFYKHAQWFTNGENVNEEVYPDAQNMIKVGKKKAGRLLDGRLWNEMPKTTFS